MKQKLPLCLGRTIYSWNEINKQINYALHHPIGRLITGDPWSIDDSALITAIIEWLAAAAASYATNTNSVKEDRSPESSTFLLFVYFRWKIGYNFLVYSLRSFFCCCCWSFSVTQKIQEQVNWLWLDFNPQLFLISCLLLLFPNWFFKYSQSKSWMLVVGHWLAGWLEAPSTDWLGNNIIIKKRGRAEECNAIVIKRRKQQPIAGGGGEKTRFPLIPKVRDPSVRGSPNWLARVGTNLVVNAGRCWYYLPGCTFSSSSQTNNDERSIDPGNQFHLFLLSSALGD